MTAWIYVDTTHSDYPVVLADCGAKFHESYPNNILSVIPNIAGTAVVIKVTTVGSGWTDSCVWSNSAVLFGSYDEATHHQIRTIMSTDLWKTPTLLI